MHSVLNLVLTTILCRKRQEDDGIIGPSNVKKNKAAQKKKKSPKRKKTPKKKKTPVKKSNRRLPLHYSLEFIGA